MNSSITQAFSKARSDGRPAFIPYLTGGFPDNDACLELMRAWDQTGADVIEIGIPFSDPLADGPTIQSTSNLALQNGATPYSVLDLAGRAAASVKAPLVTMTSWNPVVQMTPGRFAKACLDSGISGVIIPDLPPEEAGPWLEAADRENLNTIFLTTPTTSARRLSQITKVCSGFLYYVPLLGVTGSELDLSHKCLEQMRAVRRESDLPVGVGFGVSNAKHVSALAKEADGVIVGSALMRCLLDAPSIGAGVASASQLAAEMIGALKPA